MDTVKTKIVAVLGPTASGKTDCAVTIAEQFNGEVVSADSRQVYRGLDIGTAKVTPEEMRGIPHHLIDIVDVTQVYTVSEFVRDATLVLAGMRERGVLPIIAGGTFFYVDTLLDGTVLPQVPINTALRSELEEVGPDELVRRLQALDPIRAETVDTANRRRVIRAIEIAATLGSVPPIQKEHTPYHVLRIGLHVDKDTLRARYEHRGRTWLTNGFLDEIAQLKDSGVPIKKIAELGFEYSLGLDHLEGRLDEAQFITRFIEKNWQYAKRQLTWLKRDKTIQWFTSDDPGLIRAVAEFVEK